MLVNACLSISRKGVPKVIPMHCKEFKSQSAGGNALDARSDSVPLELNIHPDVPNVALCLENLML